jgi:hypothetical protein
MYDIKDKYSGIWLIYLRKSRQDDPNETIAEVLAKHEIQLQEHAMRELGIRIPEENIYREIRSGESIDEREEIKKVLARIEDPRVKGVLVIEPQRLSRGDLEDCGRLINAFRFSHTQVITPMMSYNLENKMERKFFQDELLRGRDYLEYTKEILFRGRVAAVKRGCYISNVPPYGYNRIKIGKDCTLEPNENADTVRTIFDMYTKQGLSPYTIANKLNEMSIPAPRGNDWVRDTIRKILTNQHYNGKVVYNLHKRTPVLENGEITHKRLLQPIEDAIIAEGKQPAIIDQETWEAAQNRFAVNPPVKQGHQLANPFSGVLTCANCGRAMCIHRYKNAETRFECRTRPRCCKTVKHSELHKAILFALEHSELPQLQLKVKNGDGNALKIQQRLLEKLEKQMQEYKEQEENQYELLEIKKYSQELFDRRNGALRAKMEICQQQIYDAKQKMPQNVDYEERVTTLQAAIDILKDPTAQPLDQNRVLKSIIKKIIFTGSKTLGRGQAGYVRNKNDFSIAITLLF